MANKRQSKCRCCREIFDVDVRNRGRQKYCPKASCRAAGKAARQRRWLKKPENQDYFRGPENVDRVRVWRAAHPGYWRSHRRRERVALQDALGKYSANRGGCAGIDYEITAPTSGGGRCAPNRRTGHRNFNSLQYLAWMRSVQYRQQSSMRCLRQGRVRVHPLIASRWSCPSATISR